MKISFYTIDKTIVLAISYYQRTSMFFFRIRPYVCGVVRCHPTALFLVFWHDHTADGGSLLKYYVHTERHCYIPHWQNGCSTVQHRSALLSERFNSMRCFFTEWWGRPNGTFSSFDKSKPKDYNLSNVSFTILMLVVCTFYFVNNVEMNPNQIACIYIVLFISKSYQKVGVTWISTL